MEKKISFGFSKISKKTNLLPNKIETKNEKNGIELIKCLEGQTIQLVEKKEEEAPLIIPLKDGGKTSAALLSLRTRQAVLNGEEILSNENECNTEMPPPPPELNGNGIEDIEKRAARELLAELKKGDENESNVSTLVLPIKAEELPLDGAKESTIDDYESIPITQFGKAMLRGMGWKDQPKKKGGPIEEGPVLRPKGMGLGADKALKSKALLVPPDANEILEIKKGACVLVLGGKHKDLYGQIEGLDDHAGRVIVKMALGGVKESFNEFMVQPVSKKEYAQYSKCINSVKYDEYKRMENEHGQIILKKENIKNENDNRSEERYHSRVKNEDNDHKYNSHSKYDDKEAKVSSRRNSPEQNSRNSRKTERRSRSRDRRDEEYPRCSTSNSKYSSRRTSPSKHRSKSNDSLYSSESNSHQNKHKKKKSSKSKKSKKSKDKKHERRHSSDSSSDDERRHKKKTKKSKRERSRSRSKARR